MEGRRPKPRPPPLGRHLHKSLSTRVQAPCFSPQAPDPKPIEPLQEDLRETVIYSVHYSIAYCITYSAIQYLRCDILPLKNVHCVTCIMIYIL